MKGWRSGAIVLALCGLALGASGQTLSGFGEIDASVRDEPIELTADSLEYESSRGLYVARGNVVILQGERRIRADWVAFNQVTGVGVASGGVVFEDSGEVLRAEFLEFNLHDLTGVIHDGDFESGTTGFRAHGTRIVKTGPQTYEFQEGTFTTCRCPDPEDRDPWVIRAEDADLAVGGYGTVRNTTVDVLGIPVVWLPWMIYPIKTERQSGLLFPEISLGSRKGFGGGLPLFLALRDEVNLTLTPGYYSKRGFKGDADLEYVFGEQSWGNLSGSFAYDEDIDPDSDDEPFDRERWMLLGEQDWFGPADLRFQTRFEFASDNQVPIDFEELRHHRAARFLESSAALGRSFGGAGRYGLAASATFYDDLQNPDDLDRDDHVLQRLPAAHAAVLPGPLPFVPLLVPSLDADYAWFQPLEDDLDPLEAGLVAGRGSFLDTGVDGVANGFERPPGADPHLDNFATTPGGTEGDGFFQEGERLLDEGHRLVLHPKLGVPLHVGPFAELYSEVGWHQTLYQTREHDFDERGFLTARVDARTRLRGTLGDDWVHVLEPRAGWALAWTHGQRGNPLFVPGTALPQDRLRALDLDNVTRDSADRIPRANLVSAGFSNRFHHREGRLAADLTLLGVYDFEESEFSSVVLDAQARPGLGLRGRFQLAFDPDEARVDEGLAGLVWRHPKGHGIGVGYRYLRDIPETFEAFQTGDRFEDFEAFDEVNQFDAAARVELTERWSIAYRLAYSFERDITLANEAIIEYFSRCECWALGLELSSDRASEVEVKLLYRLVGLGRDEPLTSRGFLDVF